MEHKQKKTISLRSVHIVMILAMIVLSGIVGVSTYRLLNTFARFSSASKQHVELMKATHDLMEASDYLTENAQRFTVNGERIFMDQYFTEANESKRREAALAKMGGSEHAESAFIELQEAMNNSVRLMDQEYYAMRLVVEAKGITGYPEVLDDVILRPEDEALSAEGKMRRATELVLNEDYYKLKDLIRKEMHDSRNEVDELFKETEDRELNKIHHQVSFVIAVIIIQILSIFVMLRITSHLGINPILRAVERIKSDDPIPENGGSEFIYLAQAYNKMYAGYKNSLERLSYKASHDELTGAYNRAGYDVLLSSIDLKTTYMMLFDVDNFKSINDNYGHETGDKVLIKFVQVLKSVFRDDDCICRIGGDEFVVLMVHSSGMKKRLIENKIGQIKSELMNTEDGLPPISISAGIVSGKEASDPTALYEKSDAAMYESKKKGKDTFTFYSAS